MSESNPYFNQEKFINRTDINTRIEKLLKQSHTALLLYGQRGMDKTFLLKKIGNLLPDNIIPIYVNWQFILSLSSDYATFLYNLASEIITSTKQQSAVTLPSLTRETLTNDPFTRFDEWLDEVEEILGKNTALLMLDEFEALDSAITTGHFNEEDVLGTLRHLIQHRSRFRILLAGSDTIEEYQRWANYLINVQVVNFSY